jgi:hypothetical protein
MVKFYSNNSAVSSTETFPSSHLMASPGNSGSYDNRVLPLLLQLRFQGQPALVKS